MQCFGLISTRFIAISLAAFLQKRFIIQPQILTTNCYLYFDYQLNGISLHLELMPAYVV